MGIDGIYQLLRERKHVHLHRIHGESRKLTLLLHHHDIPAAFADPHHRLVMTVHLKGAAARGVAAILHVLAHALRDVGYHLRKVVDLRVAVADKQHAWVFLREKCS